MIISAKLTKKQVRDFSSPTDQKPFASLNTEECVSSQGSPLRVISYFRRQAAFHGNVHLNHSTKFRMFVSLLLSKIAMHLSFQHSGWTLRRSRYEIR